MFLLNWALGFFPIGVRNGWTAVAELTDEHGRMQLYLVGWVTWVLAMALLALVAWATAHWEAIQLKKNWLESRL